LQKTRPSSSDSEPADNESHEIIAKRIDVVNGMLRWGYLKTEFSLGSVNCKPILEVCNGSNETGDKKGK